MQTSAGKQDNAWLAGVYLDWERRRCSFVLLMDKVVNEYVR